MVSMMGKQKLGATESLLDTLKRTAGAYINSGMQPKELKVGLLDSAIRGVSGIAPVIDRSKPTIYVRLLPEHGAFVDGLLFPGVTTISAPGGVKTPADVKVDVMPAVNHLIWKRVVPAGALLVVLGIGIGYFMRRRG
jgi:hypothetical protein